MKLISFLTVLILFPLTVIQAQPEREVVQNNFFLLEQRLDVNHLNHSAPADTNQNNEYPSPRSVMLKSLMIPGWGQIENRQIWKVPVIYGMFAGVGLYTAFLHDQYSDYRAAYYNSFPDNEDFRFGPTPERLEGIAANQLQSNRDSYRNQRDFMFIVMGLAYGLNALDAYVYAHMRSFDVSDDLSARTTVSPVLMADGSPGISLSLSLRNK